MNKELAFTQKDFRLFLQHELVDRCQRNPKYSLRAFAKALGVSSSALSAMINGKRPITKKMQSRLGQQLGLEAKIIEQFFKQNIEKKSKHLQDVQQLNVDTYAVISDWYHYAILELLKIKNFDPNPKSISTILGITKSEANIAVERLQRVGLLKIENDKWQDTSLNGHATNISGDLTSFAQKKLQKQVLEMSLLALQDLPIEVRSHTSITVAINPKDLSKAKEKIKQFRRELGEFFEENKNPTEVYNLSVSLYPITKNQDGELL